MPRLPEHLVLFDGVCNFCNGSVQFIIKHDKNAYFKFAPIQSPLGQEIYRKNGLDPANMGTFLYISDGGTFMKSDAVLEVAKHLDGPWRFACVFRIIPRFIRDFVYSMVVIQRYRIYGKKEACMMPTPEIKARFVG